jgi:TRAP-type C4-dicarboxylate transport system substrate-binding protein
MANKYPHTPDGRYVVANHRLWRCTDPRLTEEQKRVHIKALKKARRAVRSAQQQGDDDALRQARQSVQEAKEALGERGPVWWEDGAPDEGGLAPHNSSYAQWWASHS